MYLHFNCCFWAVIEDQPTDPRSPAVGRVSASTCDIAVGLQFRELLNPGRSELVDADVPLANSTLSHPIDLRFPRSVPTPRQLHATQNSRVDMYRPIQF